MFPIEPRYASLPNIMKAKKKPIQKFTPADLGIDLTPRIETIKVAEPPKRVGGGKVRSPHQFTIFSFDIRYYRWRTWMSLLRSSRKQASLL